MIEDLAYYLARTAFEINADLDEEWNDRQHFKVPVMYYTALAKAAIDFIEERNATH